VTDYPVPRAQQRVAAQNGVVAAAHPLAAEAGLEMLQQGGNAVDAAVATAFALGVLEPMMAGIGGGGSMTIWMETDNRADHVEFYPVAKGDPDYALDEAMQSEDEEARAAITPERLVGVPGAVGGLLAAHEHYGTLPVEAVLEPAVRLARDGFLIHTLLAGVIVEAKAKLTADPEVAAIFYPDSVPLQAGDRLVQAQLAETLERIAKGGRDGFYRGPTAEALVAKLSAGGNPITLEDLANYGPNWRRPVCGTYHGYTVLGAPPPMAGTEVVQTLALLDRYDVTALGLPYQNPDALGKVVDAIRIARADRDAWVGAPDDAAVPGAGITSAAYAAERAALVGAAVTDTLAPGDPWDEDKLPPAPSCAAIDPFLATPFPKPEAETSHSGWRGVEEYAQTTHLSVVDKDRNAVSMTYTMGLYFGSGTFSEGAFYNTAAMNFGGPEANRRGPYRSPRSSTAPSLVLQGDDIKLVVGSPASGRIPPAIVHTIIYTLDFGFDPARAVAMPRIYPAYRSRRVQLEQGFTSEALAGLRARGYDLAVQRPYDMFFGGVHVVLVRDDGWLVGAADPRRDGAAVGY
jgi:gamma-glutamyltranspeptidase/glutathione hydrolase